MNDDRSTVCVHYWHRTFCWWFVSFSMIVIMKTMWMHDKAFINKTQNYLCFCLWSSIAPQHIVSQWDWICNENQVTVTDLSLFACCRLRNDWFLSFMDCGFCVDVWMCHFNLQSNCISINYYNWRLATAMTADPCIFWTIEIFIMKFHLIWLLLEFGIPFENVRWIRFNFRIVVGREPMSNGLRAMQEYSVSVNFIVQ